MTKQLFFKGLVAILLVFTLSGCNLFDAEYISSDTTTLPKIKYMKDEKGNCFAYTGSKTVQSYIVFSISEISCKNAGL
jgi:hypothetical protein